MKQTLTILSLLALFIACDNTQSYKINGTFSTEEFDGQTIYLVDITTMDQAHDSVVVKKNNFSLKGKIDSPSLFALTNKQISFLVLFVENGDDLVVDINMEDPTLSKVIGSTNNDLFREYLDSYLALFEEPLEELMDFMQSNEQTPELREEANAKYSQIQENFVAYIKDFLHKNPRTILTAIVLADAMEQGMSFDDVESIYNNLNDDVKASETGKMIAKAIEREKYKSLEIGDMFRDLKMPTPSGKDMSISEYAGKGKYVLLDFWASWCGPCRQENPNLVKLYSEYKDKGFEIIGISLDKPGEKDNWIKGIEEDGLTWPQMSDLNYGNSEAALKYKIQGIPYSVLLDKEGKVIATSLRGDDLAEKLKELMP